MGLWNRLTRRQERSAPFRLVPPDVMATREDLATLATIRCQELDGFVEGLFGEEETVGLPERAHRGLETLSEMRPPKPRLADTTYVPTAEGWLFPAVVLDLFTRKDCWLVDA